MTIWYYPTVFVKNHCIGIIIIVKIHTRKTWQGWSCSWVLLVRTLINLSHIFPTTVKSDSRKMAMNKWERNHDFFFLFRFFVLWNFWNPQWVGTNEKSAMFYFLRWWKSLEIITESSEKGQKVSTVFGGKIQKWDFS